jgi:hypothetical protein
MGAEKLAKWCDYNANGGSVPLPYPPPADIPHNATLEERRAAPSESEKPALPKSVQGVALRVLRRADLIALDRRIHKRAALIFLVRA